MDFAKPAAEFRTTTLGTLAVTARATGGQAVVLNGAGDLPVSVGGLSLRVLTADPVSPAVGEYWYRSDTSQLCVRHDASTTKRSAAFT